MTNIKKEEDHLRFSLASIALTQKQEARLLKLLKRRRQPPKEPSASPEIEFWGCSLCDGWNAPPGTPLHQAYKLEPSFADHNLSRHHSAAQVILKKQ